VIDGARIAVEDHQARTVPRLNGVLGDKLRREIIIKIAGLHKSLYFHYSVKGGRKAIGGEITKIQETITK
jgi:hypothetical protein